METSRIAQRLSRRFVAGESSRRRARGRAQNQFRRHLPHARSPGRERHLARRSRDISRRLPARSGGNPCGRALKATSRSNCPNSASISRKTACRANVGRAGANRGGDRKFRARGYGVERVYRPHPAPGLRSARRIRRGRHGHPGVSLPQRGGCENALRPPHSACGFARARTWNRPPSPIRARRTSIGITFT